MYYSTKEPKDMGKWCDVCNDSYSHCYHGRWKNGMEDLDYLEGAIEIEKEKYEIEDLDEQDILKKINNKPRNNT